MFKTTVSFNKRLQNTQLHVTKYLDSKPYEINGTVCPEINVSKIIGLS